MAFRAALAACTQDQRFFHLASSLSQDIDQISVAASQQGALPQQVQQAFLLLSASLDRYLAAIPTRYMSGASAAAAAGAAAAAALQEEAAAAAMAEGVAELAAQQQQQQQQQQQEQWP
jgi:hypothetical protein